MLIEVITAHVTQQPGGGPGQVRQGLRFRRPRRGGRPRGGRPRGRRGGTRVLAEADGAGHQGAQPARPELAHALERGAAAEVKAELPVQGQRFLIHVRGGQAGQGEAGGSHRGPAVSLAPVQVAVAELVRGGEHGPVRPAQQTIANGGVKAPRARAAAGAADSGSRLGSGSSAASSAAPGAPCGSRASRTANPAPGPARLSP